MLVENSTKPFTSSVIEFLDIIQHPVFYLKRPETGFCLRLQVNRYAVGPNQ
jgi:hypothetical protein